MKIIKSDKNYSKSINFVDKNNVFVGYDLSQECCEDVDWFISKNKETEIYDNKYDKILKEIPDLKNYIFDVDFFEQEENCSQLDAGQMVRFKLTNGKEELFLHLYNSHNGYYSHGFEFKNGDEIIREDFI